MAIANIQTTWLRRAILIAVVIPSVLIVAALGALDGLAEFFRYVLPSAWKGEQWS